MTSADFGEVSADFGDLGDLGETVEDWRDDPAWRLIAFEDDAFGVGAQLTHRPAADAELAQPDGWASLYRGSRIAATWSRIPFGGSDPSSAASTIPVSRP